MWLKYGFDCLWCGHDMLSSCNTHYFGYHADHTCGREGDLLSAWWNQGLSCTGCNIIKGDYAQKFFKLLQNNPDKLKPTEANIDRVRREFKAYIAAERAKITKRFEEHERPFLQSLRRQL
jgi:hypothetical protein